jgi:autotransporter-associated beta strand protein
MKLTASGIWCWPAACRVLAATTAMLAAIGTMPARAQSWLPAPADSNYNNGANWSGGTVPTIGSTAVFDASSVTTIGINATTNVGGWTFDPGASTYVFNINGPSTAFSFFGSGIVINGGGATINVNSVGGSLTFGTGSTAGASSIFNNSQLLFAPGSTAGSASINNSVSGRITFQGNSTAGNAIIANSGVVSFLGNSTAGSADISTRSGATVDFSQTSGPTGNHQVSAGSIAGSGNFFLGANTLTVGGNGQSMAVLGIISEGGIGGGTGASLVKTGSGSLQLIGSNSYTGSTTVNGGVLEVDGSIATSSLTTVTGLNAVLQGQGTVGNTQIDAFGTLMPGNTLPGTSLIVGGSLTFQSNAQYVVQLSPSSASSANVTGAATLGGASVQAIFNPGSYVAKTYTSPRPAACPAHSRCSAIRDYPPISMTA